MRRTWHHWLRPGRVRLPEGKPAPLASPIPIDEDPRQAPADPWNSRYAADGGIEAGAAGAERLHSDPIHYMLHPFLYQHAVSKPLTGDANIWWLADVGNRYLRPAAPRALSIGCGTAVLEEILLVNGFVDHITAYETAPAAIEVARRRLSDTALADQITLRVGDVLNDEYPDACFDLVFVAAAIHHFSRIEEMFKFMHRVLKPCGLLIYDEYVGPDHHQHPNQLYDIMDKMNECLDSSYRIDYWSGTPRSAIKRVTLEEMLAHDASEGVHSSQILPLTYQYFDVIERKNFGGALLRTFFAGILNNFDFTDNKDQTVGRLIILIEQLLAENAIVPHHNAIVIARPLATPRSRFLPIETERMGYSGWSLSGSGGIP